MLLVKKCLSLPQLLRFSTRQTMFLNITYSESLNVLLKQKMANIEFPALNNNLHYKVLFS